MVRFKVTFMFRVMARVRFRVMARVRFRAMDLELDFIKSTINFLMP